MVAVGLAARFLRGGLQVRGVDVADGHRLAAALGLQFVDNPDMLLATVADADKAHADPVVGPLDAFVGDGELGMKRGCRGRSGRGLQKIATRGFWSSFISWLLRILEV